MGAVRVAFAVIQSGGVGGSVSGGALDDREPLAAVEQDRDERVPQPVGCIRSRRRPRCRATRRCGRAQPAAHEQPPLAHALGELGGKPLVADEIEELS